MAQPEKSAETDRLFGVSCTGIPVPPANTKLILLKSIMAVVAVTPGSLTAWAMRCSKIMSLPKSNSSGRPNRSLTGSNATIPIKPKCGSAPEPFTAMSTRTKLKAASFTNAFGTACVNVAKGMEVSKHGARYPINA